jgi:hypothetical protein
MKVIELPSKVVHPDTGATVRRVEVEPARARVLGSERLKPPVDDVDIAYISLATCASRLKHLLDIDAPESILENERVLVQEAFRALVACKKGRSGELWLPYKDLIPKPPGPECQKPVSYFTHKHAPPTRACDCFPLRSGVLVMFPFASVVLAPSGDIRDIFPTSGLRPVGDTEAAILFVVGGGPASASGYFEPRPVVRDLKRRSWIEGKRPADLPRHVAGTIVDVKWAIVADLERSKGYRLSPFAPGEQCGGTVTSANGVHAYDAGDFVRETATGKIVLDMRALRPDVRSFIRRSDGSWRFAGYISDGEEDQPGEEGQASPPFTIFDEDGNDMLLIEHNAAALTRDGEGLLCASDEEAALFDLEAGTRQLALDLRAFAPALAVPDGAEHEEMWPELLSAFGTAEEVAQQSVDKLRAALSEMSVAKQLIDDKALAAAIGRAKKHPKLSSLRAALRT